MIQDSAPRIGPREPLKHTFVLTRPMMAVVPKYCLLVGQKFANSLH